ncbi:MAG: hypothetical protein F4147_10005 [Gammaproteobacteria bacterium]|nr:hypothetical protein [Gammaproteobacteria bacterium]
MILDLVRRYLHSTESSWSNGISGAIAEFMYDAGESVSFGESATALHAVTDRGAIAVNLAQQPACFAYEDITHCTGSWTQALSLALPESLSRIPANHAITALGADTGAVRSSDRDKQLFDLGLGSELARFCVRTGDPDLARELNSLCGKTVHARGQAILALLQQSSPQRIVVSALGRIEVYTPIPQKGGHTESGPHTHLLPGLLGKDKAVLPPGYSAVMHVYPPHPLHDKYGMEKPFDPVQYHAFQDILKKVGIENYLKAKTAAEGTSGTPAGADSRWYDIARRIVKIQQEELRKH